MYGAKDLKSDGQPILDVTPHSFAGSIDFSGQLQHLQLLYTSNNVRKTYSRKKADETKPNAEESDSNEENVADDGGRDGDDGRLNSYTISIKLGDPIPMNNPAGEYPPRWGRSKGEKDRKFRELQRIKKLFELIPVMNRSQMIEFL